jgi:hypothetical protein
MAPLMFERPSAVRLPRECEGYDEHQGDERNQREAYKEENLFVATGGRVITNRRIWPLATLALTVWAYGPTG